MPTFLQIKEIVYHVLYMGTVHKDQLYNLPFL